MRARWVPLLAGVILASGAWGCGHSPNSAARSAQEFADAAFQRQDLEEAYDLLTDDARVQMSKEQLGQLLLRMHPVGAPSGIHAVEYELLPNREAINVFLLGDGVGETFSYRLTMDGNRLRGYGVGGLYRYLEGFPAGGSRVPLEPQG